MEGGDLSESVGVVQHWSLRSFGGHMKLKETLRLAESLQTWLFCQRRSTKKYRYQKICKNRYNAPSPHVPMHLF